MDPNSCAQDVIRCEVCETTEAQHYCDRCQVRLCKGCLADHISSDESKDHTISKFQAKTGNPSSPVCASHDNEPCHMFCEECNIPMCLKCIASNTHIGHKLSILKDVFYERKETIQRDKDELEQLNSPTYDEIATSIEQRIKEAEEDYEELITVIMQHEEKWIKTIKGYIGNIKSGIMEMKRDHLKALENHLSEINQRKAEVDETLKSCLKMSKSNDMMAYLNYRSKNEEFKQFPAKVNVVSPHFIPKNLEEEKFGELFGDLTKMSITSEENGYTMKTADKTLDIKSSPFADWLDKPEIEYNIPTGLRCFGIACVNPEEIWTRCQYNRLKLYSTSNRSCIKEILIKTSIDIQSIAVTRSGDLVHITGIGDTITIERNNKKEELIKYELSWKARCVCCTSTDDILVVESGYTRPKKNSEKNTSHSSSESIPSVRVAHYCGSNETQSIQFDDEENPLFSQEITDPHICENNNKDICVCYVKGWSVLKAGELVVVSQVGKLKFRYTGQSPNPKNKEFVPAGLATNSQSLIFVVDSITKQKQSESFYFNGIKDWNMLPAQIKPVLNTGNNFAFKRNVKKFLLERGIAV
ncbi:uncharacterized protein LOC134246161 [Saccostrea cucullata]|uniref:uncharacterized protein LOC134246161 n=1 Tax=Saccostrea cuccullata TaxID=36930 RepID=UPI002ED60096